MPVDEVRRRYWVMDLRDAVQLLRSNQERTCRDRRKRYESRFREWGRHLVDRTRCRRFLSRFEEWGVTKLCRANV